MGNDDACMRLARRLALVAFTLVAALLIPASAQAADPSSTLGVFVGANQPAKVAAHEQWRGRPVARVLDYLADDDWSKIDYPNWWTSGWGASPYKGRMVYSVPMLPRETGTMQAGALGHYDHHFASAARVMVAAGQGKAVIRPGWEFNGNWYRWSAWSEPRHYIDYFRRLVTAMRSVRGAAFKFDWSVNMGPSSMPADGAYPGDAYVDYIGMDVYDHYWGPDRIDPEVRWNGYMTMPYGLAWHRDFARAHGKPMTIPEWGVTSRSDGYGGGDAPSFVQHMYDWIAANDVAYSNYFEYDEPDKQYALMGGRFPQSAAKFRSLFGAAR